ncbi:hypothetical protein Aduo_008634 [Ancylostoma duodenale]
MLNSSTFIQVRTCRLDRNCVARGSVANRAKGHIDIRAGKTIRHKEEVNKERVRGTEEGRTCFLASPRRTHISARKDSVRKANVVRTETCKDSEVSLHFRPSWKLDRNDEVHCLQGQLMCQGQQSPFVERLPQMELFDDNSDDSFAIKSSLETKPDVLDCQQEQLLNKLMIENSIIDTNPPACAVAALDCGKAWLSERQARLFRTSVGKLFHSLQMSLYLDTSRSFGEAS